MSFLWLCHDRKGFLPPLGSAPLKVVQRCNRWVGEGKVMRGKGAREDLGFCIEVSALFLSLIFTVKPFTS